jgi:hypothetical protein
MMVWRIGKFREDFPFIQIVPVHVRVCDSEPLAAPDVQADHLIHFVCNTLSR